MRIYLKAYGIAREILGNSVEMELNGTTVQDLRQRLISVYPELAGLSSLLVAVNQQYANEDTELKPDDEVVLIPPVSGG